MNGAPVLETPVVSDADVSTSEVTSKLVTPVIPDGSVGTKPISPCPGKVVELASVSVIEVPLSPHACTKRTLYSTAINL